MKKYFFLITMLGFLPACLQGEVESSSSSDSTTADSDPSNNISDSASVSSLELNAGSRMNLAINGSTNLMLTVFMSDGSSTANVTTDFDDETVKWFSNNANVVTVSDSGHLVAVGQGVTEVKATLGTESVLVDVIVTNQTVSLTHLSFHQKSLGVSNNNAMTLTLDTKFSDGSIDTDVSPEILRGTLDCNLNLSSSKNSVVVMTQSGVVTPVADGISTLKAQCGGYAGTLTLTVSGLTAISSDETETLESMTIQNNPDDWTVGDSQTLIADLTFNTGMVSSVSDSFVTPSGAFGTLEWSVADSSLLTVSNGVADLLSYGSTTLTVSYGSVSANLDVSVKMQSEDPPDYYDSFLESDDILTITYGTNGGYGSSWFPAIVYGEAWTGGTDVVSLGGGGALSVELNAYVVVDGPGPDFTLFENVAYLSGYDLFAERAQISVSENGVDFVSFSCDVNDTINQIYAGCAGVHLVDAMADPFDPTVSGGDSFDLADVGLSRVKYILIEDLDTCVAGDPTYPLCTTATTQGFDLDALAVINGVNE